MLWQARPISQRLQGINKDTGNLWNPTTAPEEQERSKKCADIILYKSKNLREVIIAPPSQASTQGTAAEDGDSDF